MSPTFKNYSESARLLADLIIRENLNHPVFTFINPDANDFCRLVSPDITPYFDLSPSQPSTVVIVDDGSTRASEFVEFTDQLKAKYPQSQIVIATPVIPQSEEAVFKANCDRLLTLHVEPLFFEINQFYQDNSF